MEEVIVTAEIFGMPVSFILLDKFVKLVTRYKLDYLREHKLTLIHNPDIM